MLYFSFDDISCISDTPSLLELCLDGNPLCQDLSYKQTILRHVQQLKQLDMKRITVRFTILIILITLLLILIYIYLYSHKV